MRGEERKKKERRKKKEERRKKKERKKERKKNAPTESGPFHNRTHKNFFLFACVETPHSDKKIVGKEATCSMELYFVAQFELTRMRWCICDKSL